ncbi:MAG: trehalose-phosphatase [Chlamydiales bacterium]|nr:trehalose-phosphatase [Chlamydiales bacterium]
MDKQATRQPTVTISPEKFHAVIFDMDGVITKTANVHAKAWKRLFDEYLKERAEKSGEPFVPFAADSDYGKYVDGKPRYEGIESFLRSRGIELPWGERDDSDDRETICGLANKKNRMFQETIRAEGVEAYPSTVDLIHQLKKRGIKVAVISSSKNCVEVLKSAGVLDLFEAKVDGIDSEARKIQGKPKPDIFLEAAKELGESPDRSIVIEDAISGVQAGSEGNFGLVIGVDRIGHAPLLLENGADVVVKDLDEVQVLDPQVKKDALQSVDEILEQCSTKKVAIFLDYDGTMTPIVDRPDMAIMSESMRDTLKSVIKKFTVGIISGRDLKDVQNLVGVEGIFYAGSHGFDIAGPHGERFENEEVVKFVPSIAEAEAELREKLKNIEGSLVERKKYGVAAHYRLVAPKEQHLVEEAVDEVHDKHHDLRKTRGKMVFELQPKMEWHKGKALLWLLHRLGLDKDDVLTFYIGDDVTDEDAFKVLIGKGIAIFVITEERPSAASYTLKNPEQVGVFLQTLLDEAGHE